MVLIFKYVLGCVCILCASPRCTEGVIKPGREQHRTTPLPRREPRFGPSPGLGSLGVGCCKRPCGVGAQAGGTHRGFDNLLRRSERAVTSGELFLCSLQMCLCPKTDRCAQSPGFTAHETHSKCTQGETFVKWIFFFLPLFSPGVWRWDMR